MVLDSKGLILQVNPAWERMFGVTRAEARGRHSSDVFAHPKLNATVSAVLTARAGQEAEIVLTNGRCLNVEASVAGGEQDNEACAVLVFHDITELRRLEHIRKDFVANVSHGTRVRDLPTRRLVLTQASEKPFQLCSHIVPRLAVRD